jgi:hypothetical protein
VEPPWSSLIIGLFGLVAIVGCSFLLRYRVAAREYFIRRNRSMYGSWVGDRMEKRTTPMSGVGVPAIGGIIIGAVSILTAIFGHPRS